MDLGLLDLFKGLKITVGNITYFWLQCAGLDVQ